MDILLLFVFFFSMLVLRCYCELFMRSGKRDMTLYITLLEHVSSCLYNRIAGQIWNSSWGKTKAAKQSMTHR